MSGRWGLSNPVPDAGIESAARLPTSRGFAFRASAGEALDTTVTALVGRESERQAANIARYVDAQSIFGPSYDPVISPEEANDRFGLDGLTFDAPLPESRAIELAEIRRLENARRSAVASSDAGMLTLLGGGLAGSLADPLGIAVSVLPGGAAARMVPGLRGMASSTALSSRIATGALEGVAAGAAMEAIIYPLATDRERRDYTVADSLMNLALSGGFGAAGGAVRGLMAGRGARMARASDRGEGVDAPEPVSPEQLQARRTAFVSALADVAEDQPVSRAQDILDAAEPPRRPLDEDVTAALQDGDPVAHRALHDSVAVTARGTRVAVRYALVEADDLIPSQLEDGRINPDFPAVLQPRDRTRADMQLQIGEIARGLDAMRLSETFDAGQGAPLIGPDGVVESGNGRSLAIRQAYQQGLDSAAAYRAFLEQSGYPVEGMQKPVLVRIRAESMDGAARAQFAREANERTAAALSASEQAVADAAQISPDLFDLYQGGDGGLARNRDFARAFIDRVATRNDRNALLDKNGQLSGDGMRRLNDAIAAYAYRDIEALMRLAEGAEPGLKGLAGALRDAAPEMAALRAMIDRGRLQPGQDLGPHLIEALQIARQARNNPLGVAGVIDNVDAFRGMVSDETVAMLHLFHDDADFGRILPRSTAAELLSAAARLVRESADDDLLGARPDVRPKDAALDALSGLERRFTNEGRSERAARTKAVAEAIRSRRSAAAEGAEIRQQSGGPDTPDGAGGPARAGDGGGLDASPVRPPVPEPDVNGTLFDDPGLKYLADDVDALDAQLREAEARGLISADEAEAARAADGNTNPDDVFAAFDRAVRCLTGKGV